MNENENTIIMESSSCDKYIGLVNYRSIKVASFALMDLFWTCSA